MANFHQGGGNRGFRPGGRDFGRPSFGKKPWRPEGEKPMFPAVCSECGDDCQVPFRPTNGKPVYCKNCFGDKKGTGGERREFPRPDFRERQSQPKPQFEGGRGNDEVRKQLDTISSKLDRLIQSIDRLTFAKAVPETKVETPVIAPFVKASKKPTKKAKTKKKKK